MPVNNFYGSKTEDMPGQYLAHNEGLSFAMPEQSVADHVLYGSPKQETASNLGMTFSGLVARPCMVANQVFLTNIISGAMPEANQDMVLDVLPWIHYSLAAHPTTFETAPQISPPTLDCISPRRLFLQDLSVSATSPSSDTYASQPEHALSPRPEEQDESHKSSGVRVGTPRSGIECTRPSPSRLCSGQPEVKREAIIRSNMFTCGFPHCVDRQGRPKRFKHQEHKRRHEKTVHEQTEAMPSFRCWVETGRKKCGRVFSRRDNYKAHLVNTHGRRSDRKRNAYVATLDESSKYADLEWRGQLTTEGLPIGHPRFPETG